ncbi:hypothetical protein [Nocardia sp. NPDC050710]|uniref:hypothetical protein n=1 Tax=Nocardia sp. NPDC050710 TaxID=3157220 RepID=UPI0033D6980C
MERISVDIELDAALAQDDHWAALAALAVDAPAGLVGAVLRRYARADADVRRRLTWLMERLDDPAVGPLLLELLSAATGSEAVDLLRASTRAAVVIALTELNRLLDDEVTRRAAIDAAGIAGHVELVPRLRALLPDPEYGDRAALALGRMRATAAAADIAQRLPDRTGLSYSAFAVALELMGDPAAVPMLRRHLHTADAEQIPILHSVLVNLSGREPVLPRYHRSERWAAQARLAWSRLDAAGPVDPRLEQLAIGPPSWARFTLHDGRAIVRLGYDAPDPTSAWPRWNKSLLIAGEPIYRAGSDCGTCETMLALAGWPAHRAAEDSARIRGVLRDVGALSGDLVNTLAPVLTCLRTGDYLAVLVDLEVELVEDYEHSWWARRTNLREFPDDPPWLADGGPWPGTPHLQLRTPIPVDDRPTFATVMPTQPPQAFAAETVTAYVDVISAGARPAAILVGWIEERYVEAEAPERFLLTAVLDGHHKLWAYAHTGTPARALLVLRTEDSWPDTATDFTEWVTEILRPLAVRDDSVNQP